MAATISPEMVKRLRERTNAGIMDCKRALQETDGDFEAAELLLRKKGAVIAEKKAGRKAAEGLVAAKVLDGGRVAGMVEVNCETDFVAKNQTFADAVARLAEFVVSNDAVVRDGVKKIDDDALAVPYEDGTIRDLITGLVAQVGENIVFNRACRLEAGENGLVNAYVHHGSKIGVLVEVTCEGADPSHDAVRQARKDLTLQVAASAAICLSREEMPAAILEREKEVFRAQMEGKPEHILDKIIQGKLEKFFSENCLLEQAFVKDPDVTVAEYLEQAGKAAGGRLGIRRFVRFQVGEDASDEE